MFNIFLPILMVPKYVRDRISRGMKLFPIKYVETNISAKFDVFICNVNVQFILDHETPDCLGVFYKYINVVIYFNIPILKKRNLDNITIFVFPKYLIWTVFIPNTFVKFGCASGCSEPPVTPSPSNNSIFFSVLLLMHAANINCQIAYKIFMQCFNLY